MTGLELMRSVADGTLPRPGIATTLGFAIDSVEEGHVAMSLDPGTRHYNPLGTVHGGVHATLLDSVMGCAVHTLLPPGVSYTTLELKVNYVRAIDEDTGRVTARGSVIHLGGRIATAEGRLETGARDLVAHATTTCMILRPKPPG